MPMHGILEKLRFVPLQEFIKAQLGVDCECSGVYIRCTVAVPAFDRTKMLSNVDILSRALDLVDDHNQLSNGYSKTSRQWFHTNTTRNILRSAKWSGIFSVLGDGCSIFVLTKCAVVEENGGNLVFLCGVFNDLFEKRGSDDAVHRALLFFGGSRLEPLDSEAFLSFLFKDIGKYESLREHASGAVRDVVERYNRIPLQRLYASYFGRPTGDGGRNTEDGAPGCADRRKPYDLTGSNIDYEKLVGFLFLVSKKFLGPVLRFADFKILKGKLSLFIKRNVYEGISREELRKHFQLGRLKLFSGHSMQKHEYGTRCKVAGRFLAYVFNMVYIRITSYFFYSTVCANTRYRISYFSRAEWNTKTNIFYKEFLEGFEKTRCRPRAGTFRCIPKPNGFRVVTNCSKPHNTDKSGVASNRFGRGTGGFGSMNSYVAPLLPILRSASHGRLQSSLMGHSDIQRAVYGYLRGAKERQYLVRLDISRCFDNLQHKELMETVSGLLKDGACYFSEYKVLCENQTGTGLEVRHVRRSGSTIHPVDSIGCDFSARTGRSHMCPVLETRKSGIVKENRHKHFTRRDLTRMVAESAGNMVVSHQNSYYRFKKGVPQGCCVSPILCSLYYAALDTKYFDKIFTKGILCRYIDDFLIITPSLGEVKRFFRVADRLRGKGIVFNKDKMETNIDAGVFSRIVDAKYLRAGEGGDALGSTGQQADPGTSGEPAPMYKSSSVNWCGIKVSDRGIGLKCNMDDKYFRYCISLPPDKQGKRIFTKIMRSFDYKLSPLFINWRNSRLGENIYDLFFFTGRRIRIFFLRADFINFGFVRDILDWCVGRMKCVLQERGILFDPQKVDAIAQKAILRSEVLCFRKKAWT